MELRQLRHFLALAEERSITRAAKRELIVQSGLSNSLQALERELGTPLYVNESVLDLAGSLLDDSDDE